MFKTLLLALVMLLASPAFAAVDANKADANALQSIKGIGPSMSARILEERRKGAFRDWPDLVDRVKGVGENTANRYSNEGLTVNGQRYQQPRPAVGANAGKAAAPVGSKAQPNPPAQRQAKLVKPS